MTMPTITPKANTAILSILVLLGLAAPGFAQAVGAPMETGSKQFFTDTGAVCNGCKLYTYAAGTTTPLGTYSDAALTSSNANPVVLSSAGRASIFLPDRPFKFVLCSPAGSGASCTGGTVYWTSDYTTTLIPPISVLSKTTTYTVSSSDGRDVLIKADASAGSFTVNLYTAVGNAGRVIRVVKTDSSVNTVTLDPSGAQTINGLTTYIVRSMNDEINVVSDGSNWIITANTAQFSDLACDGRLTLTTGVPVTTGDVTGAGTVYFTPYVGNRIALYDGSGWNIRTFTETSLALTVTSGFNYDIFGYDNNGTLALESLIWTNDTTRATAYTRQNGVPVKSGTPTRRLLATIRASGANTTEDSLTKRFVSNVCNPIPVPMERKETTDSWTYQTATWRQSNGSTANQLAIVNWEAGPAIAVHHVALAGNSGSVRIASAIGADSTSAPSGAYGSNLTSNALVLTSHLLTAPSAGYHFYAALEWSEASGTTTWYGDTGASGSPVQWGLSALWRH